MRGLVVAILILAVASAFAQSLSGTWQVVKESNCLGDEFSDPSETEEELVESMSTLASSPKMLLFNDDNSGEENVRSKGKRKASSKEKFLYRYNDGFIYFLDKKSRLITDTFIVEELTATSLIIFHKERTCERLELTRIQ